MPAFLHALHSGRPLLMDGAMGTQLQRAGIRERECYEEWNLSRPDVVLGIHKEYVQAGADVLLTNTLQANATALARHGLADRLHAIFQAGLRLARAAAPAGFVLADVGPSATTDVNEIDAIISAIAGAAAAPDALLLETFSDLVQAEKIIDASRAALPSVLPMLISFAFSRHGPKRELQTFSRYTPKACAEFARGMEVDALGANCGRDLVLEDYLEIVAAFKAETTVPLFVKPNSGTPKPDGESWIYPHTPQVMASWLPALLKAGVRMVGGCCGTTPEHIAVFRKVLDQTDQSRN
ncbi:MAG: homocysteine S-methyltransferase family protein [Planctomycetes bacterium]|nr:homocysteine S-methyltransferase family protein [Planctomycetota bacterium]